MAWPNAAARASTVASCAFFFSGGAPVAATSGAGRRFIAKVADMAWAAAGASTSGSSASVGSHSGSSRVHQLPSLARDGFTDDSTSRSRARVVAT
ncbi:hypothetical protein D9M68_585770 [compost metagenome]